MTATIQRPNASFNRANCSAEGEVRQFLGPEAERKLSQHPPSEANCRDNSTQLARELSHAEAKPSLCRGRRVYGQDYRYDCDWLLCPILHTDDDCWFRLSDDNPSPLDELPPDA